MPKRRGTIKAIDADRGIGRIAQEGVAGDIGFDLLPGLELKVGDRVGFDLTYRHQAINVERDDDAAHANRGGANDDAA